MEPYKGMKTRYSCPTCKHKVKTFTRYIDRDTGEHLHMDVGRCSRESNCGYHYTPKQYFQENGIKNEFLQRYARARVLYSDPAEDFKPTTFIPVEIFKASLQHHEKNHFVKFLIDLFGMEVASQSISRYFIATSKHWNGATVFWQIDKHGKIRTGKIMLYSPSTGKRVKEPYDYITWVHTLLKQPAFELRQCLFGEHLLNDNSKPVAIVESEKTAVVASVYLPQFIWVAVGSLTNLNAEKCSILKGRIVTLFPDLNGYEKWSSKAKELSTFATVTVSDLLERKATDLERNQGLDLADYLVKFDYREFVEQPPTLTELVEVNNIPQIFLFSEPQTTLPKSQESGLTGLETYFAKISLPTQPLKLNPYTTITNVSKFIDSHLATVKANSDKRTFMPYLHRLQELKQRLTAK